MEQCLPNSVTDARHSNEVTQTTTTSREPAGFTGGCTHAQDNPRRNGRPHTRSDRGRRGRATTQTEHFSLIDTSDASHVFSVIATGAFTGGGTVHLEGSAPSTLRLSNGTIRLQPHFTAAPNTNLNQTTCLAAERSSGTYTLSNGTGHYHGISGSGKFTQSAQQVGPIIDGKCNISGNPVASQQIVTASGPVRLP